MYIIILTKYKYGYNIGFFWLEENIPVLRDLLNRIVIGKTTCCAQSRSILPGIILTPHAFVMSVVLREDSKSHS